MSLFDLVNMHEVNSKALKPCGFC